MKQQSATKTDAIVIRPLQMSDLKTVVAIDEKAMGEAKPEYWERRLSELAERPHYALAAMQKNRMTGFVLTEVRSWEFRQPATAWITALAVDPEYRRDGVGRRLLAEVFEHYRLAGLHQVRTMVEWSDGEVLSFFTALGFGRGPFIELEKKL